MHRVSTAAATAVAAAALAVSTTLVPVASAAPLPGLPSSIPGSPLDELGRPTPATVAQVRDLAEQPWLPREARDAILSALAFYAGTGDDEAGTPRPPSSMRGNQT